MKNAYTQFIENALNSRITDEKYMGEDFVFYVHENEGEFWAHTKKTQRTLGKAVINAVLLDESEVPIALKDLNAWETRKTLEIAVPVDITESDVENGVYTDGIGYAMSVINKVTRDLVGVTDTMTINGVEYAYVLNCSSAYVGTIGDYGKAGRIIPVSVEFVWRIFDGILANNVNIFISAHGADEYSKAVLVDGAVVRTRTGDTNAYNGDSEMKTSILQQGLTLKITLPYKASGVSKTLMSDLLKGELGTTYDVRYFDNVVATENEPIEWQMVATEINAPLTPSNYIGISVILQIAKG